MFDFNNVEMQRRSMIQTGEGEVEEEGWLVGWLVGGGGGGEGGGGGKHSQ